MKLRKKIITKNYQRVEPKHDWLKYWRVVRYWVTQSYDLSYPELEMLLFLYSEDLFSEHDFEKYERIMSWDTKRFNKLVNDDWIRPWREKSAKECALYSLSFKGKRLINAVYKKLSGEEGITTHSSKNPIFRKDAGYIARGYRKMILEMNDAIQKAKQY
jgi:hypothetical protein